MSENVCAFCRRWKLGTTDKAVRAEALENLNRCECHVMQPKDTRADETCPMWTEVRDCRIIRSQKTIH